MKIGIDLDGTITELPELFSVLTRALVEAGHEVHVITYRECGTDGEVRAELHDLEVRYTRLHLPEGPVAAPQWKAALAGELGLDVMIEDSPEVLSRMPDSVHRLWLCNPEVFDLDVCVRALKASLSDGQQEGSAHEATP